MRTTLGIVAGIIAGAIVVLAASPPQETPLDRMQRLLGELDEIYANRPVDAPAAADALVEFGKETMRLRSILEELEYEANAMAERELSAARALEREARP